MQLTKLAAVALAFPALAAAQPAAAPEAGEDNSPVTMDEINARLEADYADLDTDKDGRVTPAEINARLVKSAETEVEQFRKKRDDAFAKYDSDGNGAISKAEFEAKAPLPKIREPDPTPFLAQFDSDKDGAITEEEFRAPTLANFERLDANRDGTVSPDESSDSKDEASTEEAPPLAGPAEPQPVAKNIDSEPAVPLKKPAIKKTPPIGR